MQTIGVSPAANAATRFAVDRGVGLAEQRPPLGVADDDVLGAGLADHRRADLAGEGALALPVEILRGNRDVAVARGFGRGVERGERSARRRSRRRSTSFTERAELFDVLHGVGHRLVHLPVAADEGACSSSGESCRHSSGVYAFNVGARRRPAASGRRGTPATRRRRSRCA